MCARLLPVLSGQGMMDRFTQFTYPLARVWSDTLVRVRPCVGAIIPAGDFISGTHKAEVTGVIAEAVEWGEELPHNNPEMIRVLSRHTCWAGSEAPNPGACLYPLFLYMYDHGVK